VLARQVELLHVEGLQPCEPSSRIAVAAGKVALEVGEHRSELILDRGTGESGTDRLEVVEQLLVRVGEDQGGGVEDDRRRDCLRGLGCRPGPGGGAAS